MNIFDAERYTISVRKEIVEGDELYVARVAELQDVEEYADSHTEAYALAIDTIETAYELCLEKGIAFPEPEKSSEHLAQLSGRITLRIPKSLHFKLAQQAENEGVSLNQFIVSDLSESYGRVSFYNNVTAQLSRLEKSLTRVNDGFRVIKNITSQHIFQVNLTEDARMGSGYTFDAKKIERDTYAPSY